MKNAPFLILFFLLGCQNQSPNNDISNHISSYFKEKGLDKRTTYFDLSIEDGKLSGKTQNEGLANGFVNYLADQQIDVESDIQTLESNIAYIRNSVSNSRSNPKHSAELSTQYLMGQEVNIIKEEDGWYYIQGPDNYLSWMDAGGLLLKEDISQDWVNSPKSIVQINELAAKTSSGKLEYATDLVFGNVLAKKGPNKYITPDGTELTINDSAVFNQSESDKIQQVIDKALSLMGRPYLWGGTSTKGMDCSGFTRTAFMNADYLLGRDASLQVKEGIEVSVEDREEWKKGDLLFFGNIREDGSHRITHVAIHLGNGEMVHASERVRVESINSESPIYNQDRDKSLLDVRRIF